MNNLIITLAILLILSGLILLAVSLFNYYSEKKELGFNKEKKFELELESVNTIVMIALIAVMLFK